MKNRSFSFLRALGDTLLLFCALTGFFRSFLSLYPESGFVTALMPRGLVFFTQTHGGNGITLFCLALALFFGALYSLPKGKAPLLLAVGAGWSGLLWYWRETAIPGFLQGAELAMDIFHLRVDWAPALSLTGALPRDQALPAAEQAFFLGAVLLAFLLGWAVVKARRWWLVVLLTLPPLLPGLLSDIYPRWGFFLLLCVGWCTSLLTTLCRRASPAQQGRLTLLTLPLSTLLLGGVLLIFPPAEHQWSSAPLDAWNSFSSRYLSFLYDIGGPFSTPISYVGSAGREDLSAAGPRQYTGRTVLRVDSDDYTGTVYLRGSSFARYTGTSWEPLEEEAWEAYQAALSLSNADPDRTNPLLFPAYYRSGERSYTLTVTNTGAAGDAVYVPYQLSEQDLTAAGLISVEDSRLARDSSLRSHTVTFHSANALAERGEYSLAREIYQTTVAEICYTGDTESLPQSVMEDFQDFLFAGLTVEDGVKIRVADLSKEPLVCAKQVAEFLSQRCIYDLNTPKTPEGEDFASWFLTESRRGYCVHFATAATLMLRELGHSARYVTGFTAQVSAGRTARVPDSSAHAWFEVYVEGFGWYPVEVTPAATGEDAPQPSPLPSESESPAPSESPSHSPSPSPSSTPSQSAQPSSSPLPSTPPRQELPAVPTSVQAALRGLLKAGKLPAAAGGMLLLLWLGQRLPKTSRRRRLAARDTNRAVLDGWHYLTRLEKWGGEVPESVLALAQKARFGGRPLPKEERQAVQTAFDAQRRAVYGRLPPALRPLFRYLWGIPNKGNE